MFLKKLCENWREQQRAGTRNKGNKEQQFSRLHQRMSLTLMLMASTLGAFSTACVDSVLRLVGPAGLGESSCD